MSGELKEKDTSEWLCDCDFMDCYLRIDIPPEVAVRINNSVTSRRIKLQAHGCPNNLPENYEFLEEGSGYTLYQKKEQNV